MHKRRKEIWEDLKSIDATTPKLARHVFGYDYPLALKMAEDNQLGRVDLEKGHPWLLAVNFPHYKFYIKEEKEWKKK